MMSDAPSHPYSWVVGALILQFAPLNMKQLPSLFPSSLNGKWQWHSLADRLTRCTLKRRVPGFYYPMATASGDFSARYREVKKGWSMVGRNLILL